MICNQLEDHWFMCRTLRHNTNEAMRAHAHQYFAAKHTTMLPSDLETKAVRYVDDLQRSHSNKRNI